MFQVDPNRHRVIDISFLVVSGAIPDRPFDMERGLLADGAYKMDVTNTHTHVGTHVEGSAHFFDDGDSIEKYPLDAFYGRGVLLHVDLPDDELWADANYVRGQIGPLLRGGDIVVVRHAQSERRDCMKHLTEDAAIYFRDQGVKMIVLGDNVGFGETVEQGRRFHEILMRRTTFLEIVRNLEEIQKETFFVMALPVLIQGVDSSWCRAVVIEER